MHEYLLKWSEQTELRNGIKIKWWKLYVYVRLIKISFFNIHICCHIRIFCIVNETLWSKTALNRELSISQYAIPNELIDVIINK